jgi:general stress protein 26
VGKRDEQSREEHVRKLGELIKDIKVGMLTTEDIDGTLRSRPMATQEAEFDGDLWFFTSVDAPKADEVERDRHVNVSYADPNDNRYISVSGSAQVIRDKSKTKELWSPIYKAWFPKGPDDPDLALLKVHVEKAEYWDAPSSTLVQIAGFVKALATGEHYQGSEHEKINLV